MIRFMCEHCDQKIHVAEKAAGKRGCCPNCRQSVVVPELEVFDLGPHEAPDASDAKPSEPVVEYKCQMCRNTLSAPTSARGSIKECPHCGSFVEVPMPQVNTGSQDNQGIQLQRTPAARDAPEDPFDRAAVAASAVVDPKPKRLLPVLLDVFLFPLSRSGVLMLLAFTLAPLVLYPVAFLGVFGPLLYLGVMVCVWAYMFWYFSLCIHTSAVGNVRAPDTFNEDVNTTMTDMLLQLFRTILLVLICLLPPFIFRVLTDNAGAAFYCILAGCTFFLPIMLLASVMFDSFWSAWNPRVVLGGIFSSFFGYLALVVVFYIPIGLYFYISQLGRRQENMALALVLNACSIYLIMVSSHLLGWFFYKNEDKLYWSV